MPASATRESRGTHLHPLSSTKIHLLPKNSRIDQKVESASNVHRYNPVPLVLSVNSYRLIALGRTPNGHLIPFINSNDQNKSIPDLPLSAIQSLRKFGQPLPCSHSPSKFCWHPHPGQSIPWQDFLASEDTKTKAYPYLKPSYWSQNANGNTWTLLGTNVPQWPYS